MTGIWMRWRPSADSQAKPCTRSSHLVTRITATDIAVTKCGRRVHISKLIEGTPKSRCKACDAR